MCLCDFVFGNVFGFTKFFLSIAIFYILPSHIYSHITTLFVFVIFIMWFSFSYIFNFLFLRETLCLLCFVYSRGNFRRNVYLFWPLHSSILTLSFNATLVPIFSYWYLVFINPFFSLLILIFSYWVPPCVYYFVRT